MFKNLLLPLLLWTPFSFSKESSSLDELEKNVTAVHSTIKIVEKTYALGGYVYSTINPSEAAKYAQADRQKELAFLKAEEELNQCLVTNHSKPIAENKIPTECQKTVQFFVSVASYKALNIIKEEFNAARSEIVETQQEEPAPQGMSTTTKVLIGGAMVVGGGVVLVVAAPVVFPGTIIAAKAIAIKTAVGATVAYVGPQTVTTAVGGALAQTYGLAKDTKDATVKVAQEARREFVNLPLPDQIIITAHAIEAIEHAAQRARPYVYQTEEEELQHYLKLRAERKSLRERIQQARRKST